MPKPMPELKTGMFIKVHDGQENDNILAFVYDNRAIYQDGCWDEISDLIEEVDSNKILEVYSDEALCFNNCISRSNYKTPYLIWRSPEYQSYLDSKSN